MSKIKLNFSQIQLLVKENSYQVDEKNKFFSRCIDGRYEKNSKLKCQMSKVKNNYFIPALAIPGADLGELALIIACANDFGLEIDYEKVFQSLIKVVGGIKNFSYHTDSHHGGLALGCGHFGQMLKDFVAYNLQKKDIEFLEEKLKFLKKEGVLPAVLEGNHDEGAILIVKGNFGILPRFIIDTDEGKKEVSVFVYQQTLVDERHRVLAKKLIENKAVKLFNNLDEEYLYEVLSEEGENHLLETVNRLASDLPLFEVIFDNRGRFSLKSLK